MNDQALMCQIVGGEFQDPANGDEKKRTVVWLEMPEGFKLSNRSLVVMEKEYYEESGHLHHVFDTLRDLRLKVERQRQLLTLARDNLQAPHECNSGGCVICELLVSIDKEVGGD